MFSGVMCYLLILLISSFTTDGFTRLLLISMLTAIASTAIMWKLALVHVEREKIMSIISKKLPFIRSIFVAEKLG